MFLPVFIIFCTYVFFYSEYSSSSPPVLHLCHKKFFPLSLPQSLFLLHRAHHLKPLKIFVFTIIVLFQNIGFKIHMIFFISHILLFNFITDVLFSTIEPTYFNVRTDLSFSFIIKPFVSTGNMYSVFLQLIFNPYFSYILTILWY